MRDRTRRRVEELQDQLCEVFEALEPEARFVEDPWERDEGGGGRTRVLQDGALLEKAGVNVSCVYGQLSSALLEHLGEGGGSGFWATGVSVVVHPRNPHVPAFHANLRYIERTRSGEDAAEGADAPVDAWFGGGADLTPVVLYEEDARHFHETLGAACDRWDPGFYPRFKQWCDEYFYLPHRGEARGIGGLFFDYLRPGEEHDAETLYGWWSELGDALTSAYRPIVERRRAHDWDDALRRWQLQRRGRYAEFNLLYDRGTRFGLQSRGRVESIFMSLPPLTRWDYDVRAEPGTPQAKLLEVLREPRAWR